MMQNLDLKANLTGNSTFQYYRDFALWYLNAEGLMFPVPVADLDTCQLLATEKSTVLMKWIRKHVAQLKAAHDA